MACKYSYMLWNKSSLRSESGVRRSYFRLRATFVPLGLALTLGGASCAGMRPAPGFGGGTHGGEHGGPDAGRGRGFSMGRGRGAGLRRASRCNIQPGERGAPGSGTAVEAQNVS